MKNDYIKKYNIIFVYISLKKLIRFYKNCLKIHFYKYFFIN